MMKWSNETFGQDRMPQQNLLKIGTPYSSNPKKRAGPNKLAGWIFDKN